MTEVLTCYFAAKDDKFQKNAEELISTVKENAEGFKAASGGWVIEDVEHESIGSGKKGKAFVAVIGWESVEAHMKFRETQCFKDNIHLLREGPCGMVWTPFTIRFLSVAHPTRKRCADSSKLRRKCTIPPLPKSKASTHVHLLAYRHPAKIKISNRITNVQVS